MYKFGFSLKFANSTGKFASILMKCVFFYTSIDYNFLIVIMKSILDSTLAFCGIDIFCHTISSLPWKPKDNPNHHLWTMTIIVDLHYFVVNPFRAIHNCTQTQLDGQKHAAQKIICSLWHVCHQLMKSKIKFDIAKLEKKCLVSIRLAICKSFAFSPKVTFYRICQWWTATAELPLLRNYKFKFM